MSSDSGDATSGRALGRFPPWRFARRNAAIARLVAHTPLDRPAWCRVVEKAGFAPLGEVDDEHEGEAIRVIRWELAAGDAS